MNLKLFIYTAILRMYFWRIVSYKLCEMSFNNRIYPRDNQTIKTKVKIFCKEEFSVILIQNKK